MNKNRIADFGIMQNPRPIRKTRVSLPGGVPCDCGLTAAASPTSWAAAEKVASAVAATRTVKLALIPALVHNGIARPQKLTAGPNVTARSLTVFPGIFEFIARYCTATPRPNDSELECLDRPRTAFKSAFGNERGYGRIVQQ